MQLQLATVFDDAGKPDHREILAEPDPIKLNRSQDSGDMMELCFSASSKLNHYCCGGNMF